MSEAKTMMLGVVDVSASMGHPIGNSNGDTKLQVGMSTLGFYMMQRMLAVKTAEFGLVTVGPGEDESTDMPMPCTTELVRMGRTSMDTINALYKDITPSTSVARSSLVDGVLMGKEILIREHAAHKFNRMMLIITDGETEVEQGELDSLDSALGEIAQKITVYVAMLGAVDENTSSVVKKENSKLLRSIALSTIGGKYMELNDVSQSFYLMKGPGLNTRPLQYKTVLELSPQLRIACTHWSKASKTALPSLKKRAAATASASVAAGDDGIGGGGGEGGDAKRDTTYRNPEDPDVELTLTERTKGYRYGGQYVPMGIVEDSIFTVIGSAVIQVLGSVPSLSVPRHHLLSAPIVVQCSTEAYNGDFEQEAAATTMAALVQALRNTGLVLLARFVKKDNADPMLVVLLPSPSASSSSSSAANMTVKKEEEKRSEEGDVETDEGGVGLNCYKRSSAAAASEGVHVDSLLLYQLPFAEDIREFSFPSLTAFDPAVVSPAGITAAADSSSTTASTNSKIHAQQRVMSSFVDSHLISRSTADTVSAVTLSSTAALASPTGSSQSGALLPVVFNHLVTPHNAAIQNFIGSVLLKGTAAATVALPSVGDVLQSPFSTEPTLRAQLSASGAKRKAQEVFAELRSEFELKLVDLPPDEEEAEGAEGAENKNKNSRSSRYKSWRRKRQAFWSDIQITDEASQSLAAAAVTAIGNDDNAAFAQCEDRFAASQSQAVSQSSAVVVPLPEFTVGSITPIEDFVDLIEAASAVGNTEAVQQALRTLADIALRTVVTGCSAPFYRKAVEYVSKLRQVCVREGEHAFYNSFVSTEIKQDFSTGRHRQFWNLVCAAGQHEVGLITSAEDSGSTFSPADGQRFFGDEEVAAVAVEPVSLVADEDADLFDEMA